MLGFEGGVTVMGALVAASVTNSGIGYVTVSRHESAWPTCEPVGVYAWPFCALSEVPSSSHW